MYALISTGLLAICLCAGTLVARSTNLPRGGVAGSERGWYTGAEGEIRPSSENCEGLGEPPSFAEYESPLPGIPTVPRTPCRPTFREVPGTPMLVLIPLALRLILTPGNSENDFLYLSPILSTYRWDDPLAANIRED